MIEHGREEGNKVNEDRFRLLEKSSHFQCLDGLNNLRYELVGLFLEKLYTNVTVAVERIQLESWN